MGYSLYIYASLINKKKKTSKNKTNIEKLFFPSLSLSLHDFLSSPQDEPVHHLLLLHRCDRCWCVHWANEPAHG